MTHYEELGVSPSATQEEIHQAYRNAVKLMHPDRQTDPAVRDIAQQQMVRLNAIAQILLEPSQRLQYDEALHRAKFKLPPGVPETRSRGGKPAPQEEVRTPWQSLLHSRRARSAFAAAAILTGIVLVAGLAWAVVAGVSWIVDNESPVYSFSSSGSRSIPIKKVSAPAESVPAEYRLPAALVPISAPSKESPKAASPDLVTPPEKEVLATPSRATEPVTPVRRGQVLVVSLMTPKAQTTASYVQPPPITPLQDTQDSISKLAASAQLPPAIGRTPIPLPPSSPPVLLREIAPSYPAIAKQTHTEGLVIFSVKVDVDGHVQSANFLNGPPLLAEAARNAILRWQYRPATVGGTPVEATFKVTVQFRLD